MKRDLKLIKTKKQPVAQTNKKQVRLAKKLAIAKSQSPITSDDPLPTLTPAEQAEAARFRAFTKARADRQARVRRIVARLQKTDDTPNVVA